MIDISRAKVIASGRQAIGVEELDLAYSRLGVFRARRRRLTESIARLPDLNDNAISWRMFPRRWFVRFDPDAPAHYELALFVFTYLGRVDPSLKTRFRD